MQGDYSATVQRARPKARLSLFVSGGCDFEWVRLYFVFTLRTALHAPYEVRPLAFL